MSSPPTTRVLRPGDACRPKPGARLMWTERPGTAWMVRFKMDAAPMECSCGRRIVAGDQFAQIQSAHARRTPLCMRCVEPVPVPSEKQP